MRVLMLAGAMLLGAAAAHAASSIENVRTDNTERSIEHITCESCGPVRSKAVAEQPEVSLKPGEQKIEIREVDGVQKVFRTEAWFGGSPVVVVSKATGQARDPVTADTAANPPEPTIEIDPNATTSVNADMTGNTQLKAKKAQVNMFDPNGIKLRQ